MIKDHLNVVYICSMSGHRLLSSADTSFYQATKFAVKALTEGVRKELRYSKSGIRIAVSAVKTYTGRERGRLFNHT